nr:hypothetical protein [Gordonia sp. NB41Y]
MQPTQTARSDTTHLPSIELVDEYLATARRAKYRRLLGLVAICSMLLTVLIVIFAQGWYADSGGGVGWVICGIIVTICAIGGVLVDIIYRKDI